MNTVPLQIKFALDGIKNLIRTWIHEFYKSSSADIMDLLSSFLIVWLIFCGLIYVISDILIKTFFKPSKVSPKRNSFCQVSELHIYENNPKSFFSEAKSTDDVDKSSVQYYSDSVYENSVKADKLKELASSYCHENEKITIHPPIAMGPDHECNSWFNNVLKWLYLEKNRSVVKELHDLWYQNLSSSVKKLGSESGLNVTIFQPENYVPFVPILKNIFVNSEPKDKTRMTCDCDANTQLMCKICRFSNSNLFDFRYIFDAKLKGRLNLAFITEESLAVLKFDGWPEVLVKCWPVEDTNETRDNLNVKELLCEIISASLRNMVLDFHLNKFQDFPRFFKTHSVYNFNKSTLSEQKLLVKIVKATNLGASKESLDPFCFIHIDDPFQKYQTAVRRNTNCPCWDESFICKLNSNTKEIVFEIYDKSKETPLFLGLGNISIHEVLTLQRQKEIIPLQTRSYLKENISGCLTVEFQLMGHSKYPVGFADSVFTAQTENFNKSEMSPSSLQHCSTYPYKQSSGCKMSDLSQNSFGYIRRRYSYQTAISKDPDSSDKGETNLKNKADILTEREAESKVLNIFVEEPSDVLKTSLENKEGHRDESQSSRKKRDFFGTVRKRLHRPKPRSTSVEPLRNNVREKARATSVPLEVNSDRSSAQQHLIPEDSISTHSNISDASALSCVSSGTYVNEASTLILETLENSIKKYYMIPLSVACKKWRKKGTKLHLFNDHTFVAKHLHPSSICQVCQKPIAKLLGKQAYKCRDCGFHCHKVCHVHTNTFCPNSKLHTLDVQILKEVAD